MTTLKSWEIVRYGDEYLLAGVVYGHYSRYCFDGRTIRTSIIESVEIAEDEMIIWTQNTEYHLLYEEFNNSLEYEQDEVFMSFVDQYCGESSDELFKHIAKAKTDKEKFYLEVADNKLANNTLYLEVSRNSLYKYRFAVYKNSEGKSVFAHRISNTGGEIIITDAAGECIVGYEEDYEYIKFHNTLFAAIPDEKLYNPDGTELGYIKNVGTDFINVYFSWGKRIEIAPDMEFKVVYGMGEVYDEDEFDLLY